VKSNCRAIFSSKGSKVRVKRHSGYGRIGTYENKLHTDDYVRTDGRADAYIRVYIYMCIYGRCCSCLHSFSGMWKRRQLHIRNVYALSTLRRQLRLYTNQVEFSCMCGVCVKVSIQMNVIS